jgi:RNA polymerase sigma factor (TIGR02999 family)
MALRAAIRMSERKPRGPGEAGPPEEVTRLLREWGRGDRNALERLVPIIEAELRKLARAYLRRERAGHTLQTSALVNEAYVRLIADQDRAAEDAIAWEGRAHFYGIAARVMRRILVDHARKHGAAKRHVPRVPLDEARDRAEPAAMESAELLALHLALEELETVDPLRSRIVELKFFAGLGNEEIGKATGTSPATVKRHWRVAKAWLLHRMGGSEGR